MALLLVNIKEGIGAVGRLVNSEAPLTSNKTGDPSVSIGMFSLPGIFGRSL